MFRLFLENSRKIDELMGDQSYVEWELCPFIFNTDIAPIYTNPIALIKWNVIMARLRAKYPMLGESFINFEEKEFRYHMSQEIKRETGIR